MHNDFKKYKEICNRSLITDKGTPACSGRTRKTCNYIKTCDNVTHKNTVVTLMLLEQNFVTMPICHRPFFVSRICRLRQPELIFQSVEVECI